MCRDIQGASGEESGRPVFVNRSDELDAVCKAADETWGAETKVELIREYKSVVSETDREKCYWRVRLHHSEDAHIEVTHPDRLVALGMAMAAITVEGL